MTEDESADFDALLILLHDQSSGGEFGNWNAPIVEWATARLKERTRMAIDRIASAQSRKSPAGEV